MFKYIVPILLFASTCFGEITYEAVPFTARICDRVETELIGSRVAVIMEGAEATDRHGVFLWITSDHKFVLPVIDAPGVSVVQSKTRPTKWTVFGPKGEYRVHVIESDPELGLHFTPITIAIGGGKPGPGPGPVEPPRGDLQPLIDQSFDLSSKLDAPTRKALASAYRKAIESAVGKTHAESRKAVIDARIAVLNARQGEARKVDWLTGFLNPIDRSVSAIVTEGDVKTYVAVIQAILTGLEK